MNIDTTKPTGKAPARSATRSPSKPSKPPTLQETPFKIQYQNTFDASDPTMSKHISSNHLSGKQRSHEVEKKKMPEGSVGPRPGRVGSRSPSPGQTVDAVGAEEAFSGILQLVRQVQVGMQNIDPSQPVLRQ